MSALVVAFVALASHLAGVVDVDARLAEAQHLAAKQEDAAAIDAYEQLLEDGVESPALRYNLGTLLLEAGDLGGAVAQLRAARRLDPTDDDVEHNLSVALEARADRLAGDAAADPVVAVGEHVPPFAARLALALPLALLGVLLAALGFTNGRARKALAVAALIVAVASAAGAGVYAVRLSFERTREAVVVTQTSAKKEADPAAAESFVAHPGLSGVVVEDTGAYVRLRLDNGLEAWVDKKALVFVASNAP